MLTMKGRLRTRQAYGMIALAASIWLLAPGCGDDGGGKPDVGLLPDIHVDSHVADAALEPDAGPVLETFSLAVTVTIDKSALGCDSGDVSRDCAGPLGWLLLDRPFTEADKKVLAFGVLPEVTEGVTYTQEQVPLSKTMYLIAYLDDNSSSTVENPWPDQGDPIFFDLEPFSGTPGATVRRDVVFWARMP